MLSTTSPIPALVLTLGSVFTLMVQVAVADLDAPVAPTAAGSAMYSLDAVCQRLDNGATGSKRTGAFTEPGAGPADTDCSLDDVMQKAPAVNTDAAAAGEVAIGKTFWSLKDGTWGKQTGTASAGANVAGSDGSLSMTIPNGLYSGGKTATASDSDLTASNIKKDEVIFGVTGTLEAAAYPAPVATTGQTKCYKTSDNSEDATCSDTSSAGQDGKIKAGKTVTGDRFTDNNNGTVTDNLTGLIWLKNANCANRKMDWANALTFANTLADGSTAHNSGDCDLGDNSSAGDWRLPNIKELQSLVDFGNASPALPTAHPFSSVQTNYYWSSTTYADLTSYAWYLYLSNGRVSASNETSSNYVWPVRGGQ